MSKENKKPSSNVAGPGAVWRRVDLHLHSPGVASFKFPAGSNPNNASGRASIADQYVDALVTAEIQIGAITDYNGIRIDWFNLLKERADAKSIILLPGLEASIIYPKYGLHVLAIFRADEDPNLINDFLKGQQKDPTIALMNEDGTHEDLDLEANPAAMLKKLRTRFDCLLIPPHPDQKKGFMKSMKPKEAANFLIELEPDAVEHMRTSDAKKLRDHSTSPVTWMDDLAMVEFSDPKAINEIGTKTKTDNTPRATFLKLSSSDLQAVRLALYDPSTRVSTGKPPISQHDRIEQMEVTGSGFLGDLSINWSDDLSVLIGGRGVGKSAVVEVLRYGLAMKPPAGNPYQEDLVRHALGSGGRVQLDLTRPIGNGEPEKYHISRVLGEEARVSDAAKGESLDVEPSDLFGPGMGPMVFGQRDIFEISKSEEYRLALLDDLIGDDVKALARHSEETLDELDQNSIQTVAAVSKLAKRDDLQQRLVAVEHELSVFEKHEAASKLTQLKALRSDQQLLANGITAVDDLDFRWSEQRLKLLPKLVAASKNLKLGESKQKGLLEEAAKTLEQLAAGIEGNFDAISSLLTQARADLADSQDRWTAILESMDEEIAKIKQEAHADDLDADRLLDLTAQRADLRPQLDELSVVESNLKDLDSSRSNLISVYRERRLKEHTLRREQAKVIEESLKGRLRLRVEFKGQKDQYLENLESFFKSSGVTKATLKNLAAPEAADGISLAAAAKSGDKQIETDYGLSSAMAKKVERWIVDEPTRRFELERIIPDDSLSLELQFGDDYRPLERLSAGQRATALLLLLFALEGRILVLDQPEDDLDNVFVYEDIVQLLREIKAVDSSSPSRNLIIATHNANIPVLGDSELVVALEVEDAKSNVVGDGSIDDPAMRELIKSVMEGGEEAFQRRAEKYSGTRELS